MANEYLKRTPTSTGNRKTWTVSFWHKRNATSNYNNFYTTQGSSPYLSVANFNANGTIQICRNESGTVTELNTTSVFKDTSSWMHIMVSWDTTSSTSSDRAKLYVNGVLQPTTGTYPSINYEGGVNRNVIHTIGTVLVGGVPYAPSEPKGEWTDYFFVDGQALTPDVFGYYKKGDGYISAGSTQATDFKKGQWVPKAPKVIKSVINARGGFGVNGFYLPMNDDSNFGADFHCEPNSIIKLKGEEDPQPRNGAPTTTDAYVSQLRTDPYAANLVLAVPGITLENTNTELVTNGTFDTGISGWTGYNSTPTWDNVNQRLAIDAPTEFDGVQTSSGISVSANTNYTLSLDVFLGTAGGVRLQVRNSANSGGIVLLDVDASGAYVLNFNSGANTSVYIRLITSGGNTGTVYFDNISLKEAVPVRDYSADIKGSGTNKTLTANGNAGVGYEIPSYYGSAMSSAANGGFSFEGSDFAFGTGDFTFEGWFYISSDTSVIRTIFDTRTTDNNQFGLFLGINDNNNLYTYAFPSGTSVTNLGIPAINQWHHVAVERNGSIGNVYLNGVAVSTVNMSSTNYTESGGTLMRPAAVFGNLYQFYGYIQDFRVYKGVAKYKGGFDVPKPYTPVGIETWRAVPDTTANNFATFNPLISSHTLTNGNLSASDTDGFWDVVSSTIGVSSGKWYAEYRIDTKGWQMYGITQVYGSVGVNPLSQHLGTGVGGKGVGYVFDPSDTRGDITYNGVNSVYTSGSSGSAVGDIIGIEIDLDNGNFKSYRNGTLTYNLTGVLEVGAEYFFGYSTYQTAASTVNFGQNPTFSGNTTAGTYTDSNGKGLFKYEPPSGFLALCEDNLPTPAIKNPGEHFKTVLWTGDGNSGRSITGVGFTPDLVWVKERSSNSGNALFDSVRGTANYLSSNLTDAEVTYTDTLTSFNNDGFSIANSGALNANGDTYVAWCWRAGAGTTSTNTDGSITSVVSVNQDAGFSIVSYTGNQTAGATVGHGLGKAPKFILIKRRSGTSNWGVAGSILGANSTLYLNLTNEMDTYGDTNLIRNIQTSTTFELGTDTNRNELNGTHIAYCWAEIEGFSKFGSYVGNGSADGPFVYCGFKPAFVIIKRTDSTGNWVMHDNARNSTNPAKGYLLANSSGVEDAGNDILDFLSNGFKIRNSWTDINASGGTIIFAAFAESPFTTANAK